MKRGKKIAKLSKMGHFLLFRIYNLQQSMTMEALAGTETIDQSAQSRKANVAIASQTAVVNFSSSNLHLLSHCSPVHSILLSFFSNKVHS